MLEGGVVGEASVLHLHNTWVAQCGECEAQHCAIVADGVAAELNAALSKANESYRNEASFVGKLLCPEVVTHQYTILSLNALCCCRCV